MNETSKALTVILASQAILVSVASMPDTEPSDPAWQAWLVATLPGASTSKAYARELLTRACYSLRGGDWDGAERWVARAAVSWKM